LAAVKQPAFRSDGNDTSVHPPKLGLAAIASAVTAIMAAIV